MPLTREERLNDLLRFWYERRREGVILSAETLCRNCPDLQDEVRRRLTGTVGDSGEPLHNAGTVPEIPALDPAGERDETPPDIPGYEILGVLGAGGMGSVYKALQVKADRLVALKVLLPRHEADAEMRERFRREPQSQAKFQHANIVQIFDVGEVQGRSYFSMEYVEGQSLADRLQAGPLLPCEAATLVEAVARALHVTHEAGLVHRDLKPGNVLLAGNGTPKVADFGLAKQFQVDLHQTGSIALVGTPAYMAPEQASGSGRTITTSVDIHALGVLLYESLSGRRPFQGDDVVDVLYSVLHATPTPPRSLRRGIPRVLEAICLKCLAKVPQMRYESALALAEDLARWQRGESTLARPLGLAGRAVSGMRLYWPVALPGLLSVALLFVILFLWFHQRKERDRENSEHPNQLILQDLAKRKTVSLLEPDTGLPRCLDWPLGAGERYRAGRGTEAFAYQAGKACAARLLHAHEERAFHFAALVRDDTEDTHAEVGLFFGMASYPTDLGHIHLVCCWIFSDSTRIGPRGNVPKLSFFLCRNLDTLDREGQRLSRRECGKSVLRFQPAAAPLQQRPWRAVAVEVSENGLETFWEGKQAIRVTRAELNECIKAHAAEFPELAGKATEFTPTGGLGLLVHQGAASFKNVTLTPRP